MSTKMLLLLFGLVVVAQLAEVSSTLGMLPKPQELPLWIPILYILCHRMPTVTSPQMLRVIVDSDASRCFRRLDVVISRNFARAVAKFAA